MRASLDVLSNSPGFEKIIAGFLKTTWYVLLIMFLAITLMSLKAGWELLTSLHQRFRQTDSNPEVILCNTFPEVPQTRTLACASKS